MSSSSSSSNLVPIGTFPSGAVLYEDRSEEAQARKRETDKWIARLTGVAATTFQFVPTTPPPHPKPLKEASIATRTRSKTTRLVD